MDEVIIIGAGLSGLSTAYYLQKQGINAKILEAQTRLGGRIHTVFGIRTTPMEMGATWFHSQHKSLLNLLSELGIGYFSQHEEGIALFETTTFEPPQQYSVPPNSSPSYRIKGGSYSIIDALRHSIGNENIRLSTEVIQIKDEGAGIKITDRSKNEFHCNILIISVPPRLLIQSIQFSPELPEKTVRVMHNTQTWMSGTVKFAVEYQKPFWREKDFSGNIFSQSGLAGEIYDHSNFEHSRFALKGFLTGAAPNYNYEERKLKVIAQLTRYFGGEARDFLSYNDKVWNDKFIHTPSDESLMAHYNNGHPVFKETYMNSKLYFTGAETSSAYGGYMDGAVEAASSTAARVSTALKKITGYSSLNCKK